jgi:L-aminopeptidase/D-esterase-like protein
MRNARSGPVEEGAGTASRRAGGYTVGVLAQTNFGGNLTIRFCAP